MFKESKSVEEMKKEKSELMQKVVKDFEEWKKKKQPEIAKEKPVSKIFEDSDDEDL